MRRRNEKTTKQIEHDELQRLTGAHDDRATTQLDPAQLRALLGGEPSSPPPPLAEAAIGTGAMPRTPTPLPVAVEPAPVEPVELAPVEVAPVQVVRPSAPVRRVPWGPLIAVIVAATALVAVLVLR